MALYLYDDLKARQLEPFALTRPASELRAGALLVRERWERVTGLASAGFIGAAHLADFEEAGAPPAVDPDAEIPAGAVIANSRFIAPLDLSPGQFDTLMSGGGACAVRLARDLPVKQLLDGSADLGSLQTSFGGRKIHGRWMNDVWDYIATLTDQLAEDIPVLGQASTEVKLAKGAKAATIGDGQVFIDKGAKIAPYVVFDTTAGPILIERGTSIYPFTRLIGPMYVGRDSHVMGDRVGGCSIGAMSKIRGEISNSIVLGYSNKGHEGFVGHSYVGRWVNLGALTTTSNLKNTYGTAKVWTPAGLRDSGQQLLGTFFGDHVKTGIGTMLSTATLIGAGSNIFGTHTPPKSVAPFSWGDGEPYQDYDVEKFLVTAERAMHRREVTLSSKCRSQLLASHGVRWKV